MGKRKLEPCSRYCRETKIVTLENPFYKLLELEPPYLVGRSITVRTIIRGITEQQPNSFHMSCIRGAGTSAILQYLVHPKGALNDLTSQFRTPYNDENHIVFVYLNCDFYPEDITFEKWLLDKISDEQKLIPFINTTNNVTQPARVMSRAMTEARRKQIRIVIVLDHFDQVFKNIAVDEANHIRPLAMQASFIIASEKPLFELNETAYASWLGTIAREISIEPITHQEAQQLIRFALSLCTEDRSITTQFVDQCFKILFLTGLHPLFILRGAAELFELYQKLPTMPSEEMYQIITDRLGRIFRTEFARYWRNLSAAQKDVLGRVVSSKVSRNDYGILEYLNERGLVTWTKQNLDQQLQFKPFSYLWEEYIKEQLHDLDFKVEEKSHELKHQLTSRQRELLDYFAKRANQLCSYKDILEHVWEKDDSEKNLRLLRETVRQLRPKLNEYKLGKLLNKRGEGYEYVPPPGSIHF